MNKVLVASVVVAALSLVACSGGDDADEATTSQATQSLVERCVGVVVCKVPGSSPSVATLEKHGEICQAGGVKMAAGGQVITSVEGTFRWYATPSKITICEATDGCMTCEDPSAPPSATPPAPAARAGKCTGYASSCDGRAAGTCGSQDGCSFSQHYHVSWNGGGYLESECEGSATSCEELDSEESCEDQDGCSWK